MTSTKDLHMQHPFIMLQAAARLFDENNANTPCVLVNQKLVPTRDQKL